MPSSVSRAPTQVSETKADLAELQKSRAGPPGFWDPLSLADMSFDIGWGGGHFDIRRAFIFAVAWYFSTRSGPAVAVRVV